MRCHHQWMKYNQHQVCVSCKRSRNRLVLYRIMNVSIISLLLASLLTVTFPTSFDAQEAENLVRTKMIVAAAKYVSVSQAIDYTDYIIKTGHAYGMNPILILALDITESELNYRARSPLGYRGIPQIPYHLPVPQSIEKGAEILREKMVEAGSVEEAIGAYKGFGFTTNTHTRKVMRLKREIETL